MMASRVVMHAALDRNASAPGWVAQRLRQILPYLPRRLRGHVIKHLHARVLPRPVVDDHFGVPFPYTQDHTEAAMFFGNYEPLDWPLVRGLLRPGMVAIDVGANIGWYTALFCAQVGPTGRVVAVEPWHRNLRRIEQMRALNSQPGLIDIFAGVASDVCGEVTLYLNRYDPGHTIVSEVTRGHPSFPGDTAKVPSTTLDALDRKLGLERVDLVKIDVEGAELAVLRGAGNLLREKTPAALFVELSNSTASPTATIVSMLTEMGYRAYAASPRGWKGVPVPALSRKAGNVLFWNERRGGVLTGCPVRSGRIAGVA